MQILAVSVDVLLPQSQITTNMEKQYLKPSQTWTKTAMHTIIKINFIVLPIFSTVKSSITSMIDSSYVISYNFGTNHLTSFGYSVH